MFTVRAPGRNGPSVFIIRHCGLHIQHAMAFDANQSRLVLFGGQDAHRTFADTWEAPIMEPGPPP